MLTGVVVYPFVAACALLVGWRAARGGQPAFVVILRMLFVLYLGWVVGATLFPLPIRGDVVRVEAIGQQLTVNLAPLASIGETLRDTTEFAQVWILGGNVVTLAPFGFLLPVAAPQLASWRRMAVAALLFPIAIELSQLAVSLVLGYSYRLTELDDVLLNFLGMLLGFSAFSLLRPYVSGPVSPRPEPAHLREGHSMGSDQTGCGGWAREDRRSRCAPRRR